MHITTHTSASRWSVDVTIYTQFRVMLQIEAHSVILSHFSPISLSLCLYLAYVCTLAHSHTCVAFCNGISMHVIFALPTKCRRHLQQTAVWMDKIYEWCVCLLVCLFVWLWLCTRAMQLNNWRKNEKANMNTDRNGLYSHLFMPTRLFCAIVWIKRLHEISYNRYEHDTMELWRKI